MGKARMAEVQVLYDSARHLFFGRPVVFAGTPDLLGGFYSLATEVGMTVKLLVTSGRKEHMTEDLGAELGPMPPMLFGPASAVLMQARDRIEASGDGPGRCCASRSPDPLVATSSAPGAPARARRRPLRRAPRRPRS
jgi:hypothetical protein